jgi:flagellar protein FlgJ
MTMKAPWMSYAEQEIGVVEPESAKYFSATDYDGPKGYAPYCAAFANWCLEKAGVKGTGHANAISFANWGVEVPEHTHGAIVVFEWDNGHHHVSFYAGDGEFLGGNQTRAHEVCREHISFDYAIAWRMPQIRGDS